MKVIVEAEARNFHIDLPDWLLFNRASYWILRRAGNVDLPPKMLKTVAAELRRFKKSRGSWTLVEVESANGKKVKVMI